MLRASAGAGHDLYIERIGSDKHVEIPHDALLENGRRGLYQTAFEFGVALQTQALDPFAIGCLVLDDGMFHVAFLEGPMLADLRWFGKRQRAGFKPLEIVGEED